MEQKLPLPPFTLETALQKVQMAEDAWNSMNQGNGSGPMEMKIGPSTNMD